MTKALFLLVTVGMASPVPSGDGGPERVRAPVRVVTTLGVYADITRTLGGSDVDVSSIAAPNEDAHFVRPKPSFALSIRRADLFITTGLDLELWVPILLDRAGNRDVAEGGNGYVTAYTGIRLLDIPVSADRSAGDVHIFGNPHVTSDPLRALQVARNITVGLKRVAPDRSEIWDRGLADFTRRIYERLFGADLVELLGGKELANLALAGSLISFLQDNEFEGASLISRLGGWLKTAEGFRGERMICYHKNWVYFEERFGVTCADYVEAKPGIPPTPGHVAHLIRRMETEGLNVVFAASYFDPKKVESVTRRGGAQGVIVPLSPGAHPDAFDYFSLVDLWVESLAAAFATSG